MRTFFSILGAAALLASCAHTQTTQSSQQFSYQGGQGAYTVAVTPTHLTGPDYQVSRFPGGLRGTIGNRSLDVQVQGNKITGIVGSMPINLTVSNEGKLTRIKGIYGGVLGNLAVTPTAIEGNFGRCSYSLSLSAGEYVGFSTCGTNVQRPTSIQIPTELAPNPSPDDAATLAVLLGR